MKIKETIENIRLDLIKSNSYNTFNNGQITYNAFDITKITPKSCNFRIVEDIIANTNPLSIAICLLVVHDSLAEDDIITSILTFFKTYENCTIQGFYLNKFVILFEEFGEEDTESIEAYNIVCFELVVTIF